MTSNLFVATLTWIIGVIPWLFAALKLWGIWAYTIWVIKNGKPYRQQVLNLIESSLSSRTLDTGELAAIDEKHHLPWPLAWALARDLTKAKQPLGCASQRVLTGCKFFGKWVDRQPTWVLVLSTLVLLVPELSYPWVDAALAVALILSELANLLVARGMLGFVDNFRRDFEIDPIAYYEQQQKWSKTDFLGKFLLGTIVFLLTSIIGFCAAYYSIYLSRGPAAFEGLLMDGTPVQLQLLYFSIVTVATVGYGDITPCVGAAQLIAALEIVFGLSLLILFVFALSTTFDPEGLGGPSSGASTLPVRPPDKSSLPSTVGPN